jgi:hypothetical protein
LRFGFSFYKHREKFKLLWKIWKYIFSQY